MDKILELLEAKLTPVIFVLIAVVLFFISIFNEDFKKVVKGFYISQRTRIVSIISSFLIAASLVITCSIEFPWWAQLIFLVGIALLAFTPYISIYIHSPCFMLRYRKLKNKTNRAVELIDDFCKIEKYAKTTRDKYIFIYKLFDYCELSLNYKVAYSYYSKFDTNKLWGEEIEKYNERYGIILVNIGSLKSGMSLLEKCNTFLAKDRLAVAYELQDNKEKALELMDELKLLAEKANIDSDRKAMAFNDYARIFALSNGVVNAVKYYNESLKYAKLSRYHDLTSVVYSNLIITLLQAGEIEKGKVYFKEYLELLSKQKESINLHIERCNIKMAVARLTNDSELAKEAINEMNSNLETFPIKEMLHMLAQTIEIKANFKLDITDDVLKIIEKKDEINQLSIPIKAGIYDHLERVLIQIQLAEGSRFKPLKDMVDWYYTDQMRIDAEKYADEIPSACVFEKNKWLRDKYIYQLRHDDINVRTFKKYFDEITESYKENGLVWDEIGTRLAFVKEMFYITNVVNPQAMVLQSKYQPLAAEQIRIVDNFIVSTPYRKKIESIIFDAFSFSFFTGEFVYTEKLYQILKKEHPDYRFIDPFVYDMFFKCISIYESQRIIIS